MSFVIRKQRPEGDDGSARPMKWICACLSCGRGCLGSAHRSCVQWMDAHARECDPTYGRIDRDIQEYAEREFHPTNIGQRVALENTLQERRRRGYGV